MEPLVVNNNSNSFEELFKNIDLVSKNNIINLFKKYYLKEVKKYQCKNVYSKLQINKKSNQNGISNDSYKIKIEKKNTFGNPITKLYRVTKKLGEGSFGIVFKINEIDENKNIIPKAKKKVIKVASGSVVDINRAKSDLFRGNTIYSEQLRHPITGEALEYIPGITKKIKAIDKDKGIALMSYFNQGDLDFKSMNQNPIPFNDFVKLFCDLSFGLSHLHKQTDNKPAIYHRDIKPGNVLWRVEKVKVKEQNGKFIPVKKNGKIQGEIDPSSVITKNKNGKIIHFVNVKIYGIADLDGAQYVNLPKSTTYTPGYLSGKDAAIETQQPPTNLSEFYLKGDVYALGILFRKQLSGKGLHTFIDNNNNINSPFIENDIPNQYMRGLSPGEQAKVRMLISIINSMTHEDWNQRPSADEILKDLVELGLPVPQYPEKQCSQFNKYLSKDKIDNPYLQAILKKDLRGIEKLLTREENSEKTLEALDLAFYLDADVEVLELLLKRTLKFSIENLSFETEKSTKDSSKLFIKLFKANYWNDSNSLNQKIKLAKLMGPSLTKLNLKNTEVSDEMLEEIFQTCPNIKNLNISGCTKLKHIKPENLIKLETLKINGNEKLANTLLHSIKSMDDFLKIAKLIGSNLTQLNLIDVSDDIDDQKLKEIFLACPNIKTLHAMYCTKLTDNGIKSLVNLNYIDISNCDNLTGDAIKDLVNLKSLVAFNSNFTNESFKNLVNLESLLIPYCKGIYNKVIEHLTKLKELDVTNCHFLGDGAFKNLVNLENLNITNCSQLSDSALNSLINLKQLDASNCQNLSFEAIKLLTKINFLKVSKNLFEQIDGFKHLWPDLKELRLYDSSGLLDFDSDIFISDTSSDVITNKKRKSEIINSNSSNNIEEQIKVPETKRLREFSEDFSLFDCLADISI